MVTNMTATAISTMGMMTKITISHAMLKKTVASSHRHKITDFATSGCRDAYRKATVAKNTAWISKSRIMKASIALTLFDNVTIKCECIRCFVRNLIDA